MGLSSAQRLGAGLALFGLSVCWSLLSLPSLPSLSSSSSFLSSSRALFGLPVTSAPAVSEAQRSLSLLVVVAVLVVAFVAAYAIREARLTVVHESAVALIAGLLVGLVVSRTTTSAALEQLVVFDQQSFFLFLLPPIIFASGYNLKRRVFFKNLGSILVFAFAGTLLNAFFFAGFLALVQLAVSFSAPLSFLDCLIFGSLISATDPVTVLAIFGQLNVDFDLYANVFGEAVLNDAVAIVLYRAVVSFIGRQLTFASIWYSVGEFFLIFLGSTFIGVVIGLWTALFLKWTRMHRHVVLEGVFIILFAYSSYLLADGLTLSGIVSVLFCGITMAHYAYHNLSEKGKQRSVVVLSMLMLMSSFYFLVRWKNTEVGVALIFLMILFQGPRVYC